MPHSYEPHYFEDLAAGKTFESPGRTVTETDLVVHSMVSGDWTELHTNAAYAADEGPFGSRIAHGPLTFVLATGLLARTGITERTVVAFLGMNYMDIPDPLRIGETVSAAFEVTAAEEVDSRDDSGLVTIDCTMTTRDGTAVFEGDMKFLFKKEAHAESW